MSSYKAVLIPPSIQSQFTKVDNYICSSLLTPDPALESVLETNRSANLDEIDVAPNQGKFLYQLAKLISANRILEIGTLGGYSAIWFAKAVGSSGKVITLEIDPRHAEVARGNFARAGFEDVIEVRVGPALESLRALEEKEGDESFDFVFIDADKENNVPYFQKALGMCRKGAVIVVDNIARQGKLADQECEQSSVVGTRKLFEYLTRETRIEASALQTVGTKGWDGFLMATVL